MKKNIVINILGAPGSGKSTAMAYIFASLKMKGLSCEMAPEFAKELFYEENFTAFENQIYIFGNQFYRIARLIDKVDVVITDSPAFVSIYYNNLVTAKKEFDAFVAEASKSFNNRSYYLNRVADYDTSGRHQSEEQAEEVGQTMLKLLKKYKVDFQFADSRPETLDKIVEEIIKEINSQN